MDSQSGKDAPAAKRDAAAHDAAETRADAKAAKEDAKAEAARAQALPQVGDTVRLADGSTVLVHAVTRKAGDGAVLVRPKDSHWRDAHGATVLPQE